MRGTLYLLMAVIVFSITSLNKAQAAQQKPADTISTSDVQFTSIPTAADSITARKKTLQASEKLKSNTGIKGGATEKTKNTLANIC